MGFGPVVRGGQGHDDDAVTSAGFVAGLMFGAALAVALIAVAARLFGVGPTG